MPAAVAPYIRLHLNCKENETTGCWEWQGHTGSSGYGIIKVFGSMKSVHVFSYELHHGPIPDGLEVMHSCDNKLCVNPDHLIAGTHQQNMKDAAERGRMRSGENHPSYGKPSPLRGATLKVAKPVFVKGMAYGSMMQAERALGYSKGSVRHWIKTDPSKAIFITREEYAEYVKQGTAYREPVCGSRDKENTIRRPNRQSTSSDKRTLDGSGQRGET